jgi:hypothetical protein
LNNGSHWFALTWLPIDNFVDLDITSRDYHPGAYHLPPVPQQHKKEKKARTPYVRDEAVTRTPYVREEEEARTPSVRETASFEGSARTPYVHNVYNQYYPQQSTVSGGGEDVCTGLRIVEVVV